MGHVVGASGGSSPMLMGSLKWMGVVGSADYDPFGQVNRVALNAETEHPLDSSTASTATLAAMGQPADASVKVKVRALFHLLDMTVGQVELVDGESGPVLASVSGTNRSRFWSDWVQPSGRYLNARVMWPGGTGELASTGVVLEGYEYQRYQSGAQPFWTPVRFPGQYYDAETDLFENWNRYYDPSIGRYLQPEPLLANPERVKWHAENGRSMPAYAYVNNNPLFYTDPTGLELNLQKCSKEVKNMVDKLKESLQKAPKCACKTLLDDEGITNQILEDTIYTVTCHKGKIPGSVPDACGQAYSPEDNYSVSISTRKSCYNPVKLIVHELRHAGPDWIPHPEGGRIRPDIFDKIEDCINPDGSLRTK